VRGGVLIGRGEPSYLFSERADYTNFYIRVQARINKGGNSGLFFRSRFDRLINRFGGPIPIGLESEMHCVQTPNDGAHTGSVLEYSNAQVIHANVLKNNIRPDEWFTIETQAVDSRVVTLVNGNKLAECILPPDSPRQGRFALQQFGNGTVVECRKVEVKELP